MCKAYKLCKASAYYVRFFSFSCASPKKKGSADWYDPLYFFCLSFLAWGPGHTPKFTPPGRQASSRSVLSSDCKKTKTQLPALKLSATEA